jgi:hydroxylamine oxidation protein HaoB
MLPFTETRPLELKEVQLIYQHGGYWVYKVPSIESPAG